MFVLSEDVLRLSVVLGSAAGESDQLRRRLLTGLVLARRVIQNFNLDGTYEGNKNVDGIHFCAEDVDDGPGAFRACLDVGLARTSTGA